LNPFQSTGAKLTLFYVVLFFVTSAVLSVVAIFLVDGALRRQVDLRLTTEVQVLQSAPALVEAITSRMGNQGGIKYSLVDEAGHHVIGDLSSNTTQNGFFNLSLNEDTNAEAPDALRGLGQTIGTDFLVVAIDTDAIENVEDTLLGVFGVTLLCASVLAFFGGRWLSRFFLRKLDQFASTAEAITKGDVTRRMPLNAAGDEFDRLSHSLNTMLDRNAALLESQHQITNDVAHDLRTPITRLRQKLERGQHADALADTDEIIATMNALLRIAEIEDGARRQHFTPLDLSSLCRTLAEAYAGALEDQGKILQVKADQPAMINGDQALLTQLLSNLLENISAHTPSGTLANITVTTSSSSVELRISDTGPGVATSETTKLSRRFYRAEKSRGAAGSGLGLSLVQAIADLHGAKINIQNLDPGLGVILVFDPAKNERGADSQSYSTF
jgi:signal transduction histidine kinase